MDEDTNTEGEVVVAAESAVAVEEIIEGNTEEKVEETVPSNPQQECARELNDVLVKYSMTLQPTMSLVPMAPIEEEAADVVVKEEDGEVDAEEVAKPEDESEG